MPQFRTKRPFQNRYGRGDILTPSQDVPAFRETQGGGASSFLELTDTPNNWGTPGQVPIVNANGNGLEWGTGGGTTFPKLNEVLDPDQDTSFKMNGRSLAFGTDEIAGSGNKVSFHFVFFELSGKDNRPYVLASDAPASWGTGKILSWNATGTPTWIDTPTAVDLLPLDNVWTGLNIWDNKAVFDDSVTLQGIPASDGSTLIRYSDEDPSSPGRYWLDFRFGGNAYPRGLRLQGQGDSMRFSFSATDGTALTSKVQTAGNVADNEFLTKAGAEALFPDIGTWLDTELAKGPVDIDHKGSNLTFRTGRSNAWISHGSSANNPGVINILSRNSNASNTYHSILVGESDRVEIRTRGEFRLSSATGTLRARIALGSSAGPVKGQGYVSSSFDYELKPAYMLYKYPQANIDPDDLWGKTAYTSNRPGQGSLSGLGHGVTVNFGGGVSGQWQLHGTDGGELYIRGRRYDGSATFGWYQLYSEKNPPPSTDNSLWEEYATGILIPKSLPGAVQQLRSVAFQTKSNGNRYGIFFGAVGEAVDNSVAPTSDDMIITNREANGDMIFVTSGSSGGTSGEVERGRIWSTGRIKFNAGATQLFESRGDFNYVTGRRRVYIRTEESSSFIRMSSGQHIIADAGDSTLYSLAKNSPTTGAQVMYTNDPNSTIPVWGNLPMLGLNVDEHFHEHENARDSGSRYESYGFAVGYISGLGGLSGWNHGWTSQTSSGRGLQIAIRDSGSGGLKYRVNFGGWKGWNEIYSSDNPPPESDGAKIRFTRTFVATTDSTPSGSSVYFSNSSWVLVHQIRIHRPNSYIDGDIKKLKGGLLGVAYPSTSTTGRGAIFAVKDVLEYSSYYRLNVDIIAQATTNQWQSGENYTLYPIIS